MATCSAYFQKGEFTTVRSDLTESHENRLTVKLLFQRRALLDLCARDSPCRRAVLFCCADTDFCFQRAGRAFRFHSVERHARASSRIGGGPAGNARRIRRGWKARAG